jgi:hypothetical protein
MNAKAPRYLVCVLSILLFTSVTAASAVEEEEDDFLGVDTLSDEQLAFVSKSGEEVVSYIEKARAQLDQLNWMGARWNTAKARSILGDVREKSPSLRTQDRIGAALKFLKGGGKTKPEILLPIYAELDAVRDVEAFDDVRIRVDRARDRIAAGQVDEAADALVEASSVIRYTEIDLPIEETYARLTRAMVQLDQRNTASAKQTLREADEHIQTFTTVAKSNMAEEEEEASAVSAGPPQ